MCIFVYICVLHILESLTPLFLIFWGGFLVSKKTTLDLQYIWVFDLKRCGLVHCNYKLHVHRYCVESYVCIYRQYLHAFGLQHERVLYIYCHITHLVLGYVLTHLVWFCFLISGFVQIIIFIRCCTNTDHP